MSGAAAYVYKALRPLSPDVKTTTCDARRGRGGAWRSEPSAGNIHQAPLSHAHARLTPTSAAIGSLQDISLPARIARSPDRDAPYLVLLKGQRRVCACECRHS